MKGKVDTSKLVEIRTFVFGGDKSLPPSMSQKLGPLGLNAKKVGESIATQTKPFKGIRVFITIQAQNRDFKLVVKPGVTALIIKEMGNYEREKKKPKIGNRSGNISYDKVLKIAQSVHEDRSESKELVGTIK